MMMEKRAREGEEGNAFQSKSDKFRNTNIQIV